MLWYSGLPQTETEKRDAFDDLVSAVNHTNKRMPVTVTRKKFGEHSLVPVLYCTGTELVGSYQYGNASLHSWKSTSSSCDHAMWHEYSTSTKTRTSLLERQSLGTFHSLTLCYSIIEKLKITISITIITVIVTRRITFISK